jgi:hypothetical protein
MFKDVIKKSFERNPDLWKWGAVTVAIVIPSFIVLYCNHENIKRHLLPFDLLVVMTVGASLLVAKLTDVKEAFRVWFPACLLEILMSLGLVFQLGVHFYVLRGVSIAEDAEARYEREKVEADRKFSEDWTRYEGDRNSFERQQATASKTAEHNRLSLANLNNALNKLQPQERSGRALPNGTSQSPALVQPIAPVRPVVPRPQMPEDVQRDASKWFMFAGCSEFLVVVLGITLIQLFRSSWLAKVSRNFPSPLAQLAARLGGRPAMGNLTVPQDTPEPSLKTVLGDDLADRKPSSVKPSSGQSRKVLKTRAVDRPHADTEDDQKRTVGKPSLKPSSKSSGRAVLKAGVWTVMGVRLPHVPGTRPMGKPGRGCINILPDPADDNGAQYVTNLSKGDIDRSKSMDEGQWFEYVRVKITKGLARRSERAFAMGEGD